jgi:acyl-CoA dehydrogenase
MTDETGAAVRDLLGSLEVYRPDGTWSEQAERAACERLAAGGWFGAGLPEDLGGSGGGLRDAAAVAGACAASGHRLPAADTGIVAAHLLRLSGLSAPAGLVLAVPTIGALQGGRVRVHAERVPFARWATSLLVVADGPDGAVACLVDADAADITAGHNLAGEPRDTVILDSATPIAAAGAGPQAGEQLQRAGALARAIQIAAAVDRMLELAVEYSGQRRQFGRRLAQFQAVQQLLALLAAEALAARAAVERALARLEPDDWAAEPVDWAAEPVAVAKVRTGLAATSASRIAHQLHGAIGITTEHASHRFTSPVWSWREEYGGERHWSAVLSRECGSALWEALASATEGGDPGAG